MRFVLHRSSLKKGVTPSWTPLQLELAKSCHALFDDSPMGQENEATHSLHSTTSVIRSVSELKQSDLLLSIGPVETREQAFPCLYALAIDEKGISSGQTLPEPYASATLLISDLSPLELDIPAHLLPEILSKFLYIPPSSTKFDTWKIPDSRKAIALTQQNGTVRPVLESFMSVAANELPVEIATLSSTENLDDLLEKLHTASWCLNDCRDKRLHLCVNLASALLNIPCISWINLKPSAQARHWASELSTHSHSIPDLRETKKIRTTISRVLKQATGMHLNSESWLSENPDKSLFDPQKQTNYILAELSGIETSLPLSYKTLTAFNDLLRSPSTHIEQESRWAYTPTYPSGTGYSTQFQNPAYRAEHKAFLYFWNDLPKKSKFKEQLRSIYQYRLLEYAQFAVFRAPSLAGNTEFIELSNNLENWFTTCCEANPIDPNSIKKSKQPNGFNSYTPISVTDIVFGFLTPQLPNFLDPSIPQSNNPLLQAAENLLQLEIERDLDSPLTFTSKLYIALANRQYLEINKIAEIGSQRHGLKAGLHGSAGILLAMHKKTLASHVAFATQAKEIEQLDQNQLITITGYAAATKAPSTYLLLQHFQKIENLARVIAENPNLIFPINLAVAADTQSQVLAKKLWEETTMLHPSIASLRSLFYSYANNDSETTELLYPQLQSLAEQILHALQNRKK